MKIDDKKKVRIEFDLLTQACAFAKDNGGWIANPTEKGVKRKVLWYSPTYAMTEVMNDTRFACEIGGRTFFNNHER
jgi:hypothetical protein